MRQSESEESNRHQKQRDEFVKDTEDLTSIEFYFKR